MLLKVVILCAVYSKCCAVPLSLQQKQKNVVMWALIRSSLKEKTKAYLQKTNSNCSPVNRLIY